jgi:hypothetical protein
MLHCFLVLKLTRLFKCTIFYYLFKIDNLLLNFGFSNFEKKYTNMQTASFSGFIRAIFYMIAFYYIFRFLAKLFLPLVVKKVVEKAGQNMQQQQYQQQNNWNKSRANEDVVYNTENVKKPRETKKVGEYVDYEEID